VHSNSQYFCLCFPCFSAKLELAIHQMQLAYQIPVKILGQEKIPTNTWSVYLLFKISVDKNTHTESFGHINFWFN